MKNKLNRKIGVLSFLCCLAVIGGGISVGHQSKATAETTAAKSLEEISFVMDSGAAVRIKSDDEDADNYDTTGIRFSATMSADDYTALMSNTDYASVTFGMLITPIENEETNPFTYENVFGKNSVYDWAVHDSEKGVWVYEGDGSKTRITNVQSSEMTLVNGEYVMYGSRVGIKDSNIDREFFGLGYIAVEDTSGTTSYKFAEFSENGKDSNVRSIAYVAQKAIEDTSAKAPSDTAKENLQSYYVGKLASKATTYTVEHRRQNADGSYTVLESETVDSTIGATATATAKDAYGTLRRVSSGSVYANGKQTVVIDYAYEPDNAMEYRIVVSPKATKAELFAAEELQYFYEKATGLELPILKSNTPYGHCIFIGDTETYNRNQVAELATYGDAGYSIQTVDTDIIINSVSEQGKIYGVYGLLEEVFGLKIYAEEAFAFSNTNVTSIAALNVAETPSFNAGLLSGALDGNFKATMRMRMVSNFSEYGINDGWSVNYSSHTFFKLVDPDVYYSTNASWFSNTYNSAQGEPYSLCLYAVLNDTELQNVILTNMKSAIEAEPNANYFMFGYEDYGTYFCTCTNCKTLAGKNGGADWTTSQNRGYVGTYIQATNWLADAIHTWLETTYPERADKVKIGMFAYSSASYPPTSVTINVSDNAFVYFAPIGAEHGDEFSSSSNTDTQRLYEAVTRWAELANNIAIWNYASAFKDYIAPFDDIETAQGYFQAFETMAPFKMYTQGPRETDMSAFEPLRSYVFSNLMRDTSKTVSDLKEEFFVGYYGAAASEVESYYNTIQTKFDELTVATGLVQASLYASEYWSYDELIGYYDTLKSALSKVADTEIYNRVLAETMFARCALFDFYMDEYINAQGADAVAKELVQFQKDAQVCGFTYAYEGWYVYESSIAYKINAWKTNANLVSALAENTEVIKDENYAKTEYSHLYSISVTEGLEFRTDGETVALRHQGATDALTVNAAFLQKMAEAGYTQVTVTATTNTGDNTLDVFKPGSTSEYLASSKTSAANGGKVTHTLALAALYDSTAGAYDLRIQTRGWWSGVTLTINELTFSGEPMTDEEIAAVIDDETTNWASSKYASLWSVDSPQTISPTGETVVVPAYVGSSGFIIRVSSQLMNAAVEAGYTTVTIVSTTNYHNNFRIFPAGTTSASSANYLATSTTNLEDGGQVTYTIELSKLLNSSTGNYELLMQNGGWSSNSDCSVTYNSLTFGGKPIDPETLISEGLANEATNWASSEYATFWSVDDPQSIDATGETVTIPAYVGSTGFKIYFDSKVMNAAKEAGYTQVTIVSKTNNYTNNFRIFKPDNSGEELVMTQVGKATQATLTVYLSDLLNNSTGNYELAMQNSGWWTGGGCSVTYESLMFGGKPIDLEVLISEGLVNENTNWAASEYATFWSVEAPQKIDATGETVVIPSFVGTSAFMISVSSQLMNAAVAAGYTHATIVSTTNYDNNFRIFRAGTTSASSTDYLATSRTTYANGGQVTYTIELSKLLNSSTGNYELLMQNGGWSTGKSVTYNSLTFSRHYKTANFAEIEYAEYWTATNTTITTSSKGTVYVQCASGYMLSVSSELLAKAAEAGCTTVTIEADSYNFDHWFDIYNPNWENVTGNAVAKDWKYFTEKPTVGVQSWTLNLADLINDDGEYVLNMSARGWWDNCAWTITSLTFA